MQSDSDERPLVTILGDADSLSHDLVGGKGANLARLVEVGFTVPAGFCVTTAAYRTLIDTPTVRAAIHELDGLDPTDMEQISDNSATVRARIEAQSFPDAVRDAVEDALNDIDAVAYAVRSSATAEDLPSASFAGQHETFLGVSPDDVLTNVRACMASLFTDRAVSYRLRNDISHDVALAVVVQEMVSPDVAGVLFTADPLTGNRRVASVDANYGLGESIVVGEVAADNARIDRLSGEILSYDIGEKSLAIRAGGAKSGGTERVSISSEKRTARALSDSQLRALVRVGNAVAEEFDSPQDIEWALVDGKFIALQSRPITTLFPVPSPPPTDESLHVYLSFGHQQAMAEALPPLVVDFWRGFLNNGAARVLPADAGIRIATEAADRIYIDLTPMVRIAPVRRLILHAVSALSEPAADGLVALLERRRADISPRSRRDGLLALARTVRRGFPLLRSAAPRATLRFVRSFVLGPPNLGADRAWVETWGRNLAASIRRPDSRAERVRRAFNEFDILLVLSDVLPRMTSLPAAIVAGKLLRRWFPDMAYEIDAIGKGFEFEVVTQMNQQLGELADIAREHPAVIDGLADGASMASIEDEPGGEEFVTAFEAFLDEFGHRATGEIDLSRPRWHTNPTSLLRTIRSNVEHGSAGGHRTHLSELQRRAETAAARLESRADHGLFGSIRQTVVRRLIRTYRGGIQLREYPKQGVSHLFATIHDVLSEAGEWLAAENVLDQPDDVWYLRKPELLALLSGDEMAVDVTTRRQAHERYAAMVAPPLLTSEGEQPSQSDDDRPEGALSGTPVSAGVVEGHARVVRDPAKATIETGEILVAPSTDPGWTPLFLNAAGLVMEVGGRMTHGALVAREYGIPAVASVPDATTTIRTGERIRVDGKRGIVERIDRE